MILGEKIMNLRKKNGWSQEELAHQIGVSRQAVSKWESGSSIPDLDKILKLSQLFGISTDYLLKDEIEEGADGYETEGDYEEEKSVDLDEAGMFLKRKEKSAKRCAAAIMAFILSPELLILLTAGLSESGKIGLSEDTAAGLGIIAALLIVAGGVGTLILNGIGQEQYEYLEKESFYLSYGVEGVIKKKKEDFIPGYRLGIAAGVVLCILSAVPLFIGSVLQVSELTEILFLNLMIFLISLAVYLFVWLGMVREGYEMILQEGDYTMEKKEEKKKDEHYMKPISNVYWCLVTAIYLGISFYKGNWAVSWIIWPCAGVLCGAVYGLAKLLKRN